MNASEVMTENPRTVRMDDTILDAIEVLQSMEVRHAPVVDEQGDLVGMLSDRDLRPLAVELLGGGEVSETAVLRGARPISSIMSGGVISVEPDTELEEVIDLMLEHRIGAIPVVDGEGAVVGIVSYVDILRQWPR